MEAENSLHKSQSPQGTLVIVKANVYILGDFRFWEVITTQLILSYDIIDTSYDYSAITSTKSFFSTEKIKNAFNTMPTWAYTFAPRKGIHGDGVYVFIR